MASVTKTLNYKSYLLFCLLFSSLFALYYPAMIRMIRFWGRSEDYSHGFLIIPLSLYILWIKRTELRRIAIIPSINGLILTLASVVIYIVAEFARITTLASASIIPVIVGSIWFLWGSPTLRTISFPLAFLVFMIPVPSQIYSAITLPLQLFVSAFSTLVVQFIGVPIFREGNVINMPEYTFQVVHACSGLRSMVSLLALSSLIAYLSLKSNLLRLVLFVSAVPIAILVNAVRVITMVLALHFFGVDLTEDALHTYFGAGIFTLAIITLFVARGLLSRWDSPT